MHTFTPSSASEGRGFWRGRSRDGLPFRLRFQKHDD